MQHRGRHEAAEARASGFASAEAASAMGRLHGISASATKQTRKLDLREELHAAKVERARARREQKLVEQKRREILDELVGLIRDDATPAKLALCPAAAGDRAQLAQLAHATIEDVVRFLRFFEERFFFVGFFSFVGFFFRWLFLPLAFFRCFGRRAPGRGRCWRFLRRGSFSLAFFSRWLFFRWLFLPLAFSSVGFFFRWLSFVALGGGPPWERPVLAECKFQFWMVVWPGE